MTHSRQFSLVGFALALGSAACFGLSGIFASALISAGWSAGAATTARIVFAALVLLPPTILLMRGEWHRVWRARSSLLYFGLLAIVACQLMFFMAVQFIPPSLALLIEFTGPVLLMLYTWARTRLAPAAVTLVGAVISVAGLVAVSGALGGGGLHPLGILFALGAAVGNAAYWATSARSDHGIAPLPFVGLGLTVAAVTLIAVSATGLLPFVATDHPAELAGTQVPVWIAVAGMVLISTVLSYLLGVAATRTLGATVASFTGYSEPLFGIFWTALLLAILPTAMQWIGAALIITGVIVVKLGELRGPRTRATGDI